MSLKDKGFRYIIRKDERGRVIAPGWTDPALIEPGDIDCTDMSDPEFYRVMSEPFDDIYDLMLARHVKREGPAV